MGVHQWLLAGVGLCQAACGLRVLARLLAAGAGQRIVAVDEAPADARIAVLVPVLNERQRLAPCLEGLTRQGPEVSQIIVVDGGSTDGTPDLARAYAERDSRLRLVDASPVPADWNGKAWGLQVGLDQTDAMTEWVLTIDADTRPTARLARSLLAHARRTGLAACSVATLQEIGGPGEALIHPAFLTTLVYRFGIPGQTYRRVGQVQANGQCFLLRRDVLLAGGGFAPTRDSRCEDVTLARLLVARGQPVGFFEAGPLISVRMYDGAAAVWRNWSRSLPMRDRYATWSAWLGLVEVTLAQALPLPLLVGLGMLGGPRWLILLNQVLLAMRLGTLVGTRRAYRERPWTYWLSPLCDPPVSLQLWRSALSRRHTWRGRPVIDGR